MEMDLGQDLQQAAAVAVLEHPAAMETLKTIAAVVAAVVVMVGAEVTRFTLEQAAAVMAQMATAGIRCWRRQML